MSEKDFYYQIKGREQASYGGWAWPPVFSGKVSATNKKEAKKLIEEEYGRTFPLRVLSKDLDKENYLLKITEIKDCDEKTRNLFAISECKQCGTKFRIIDKYNDHNETNKGAEFCSYKCQRENNDATRAPIPRDMLSVFGGSAFIYKIRNNKTNMVYIGKTTQVFTLRWYQHFYQSGSCKFHQAIKNSCLTDWDFQLIEIVKVEKGQNANDIVSNREAYWIGHYDSVENGYNTINVSVTN